MCDLPSGGDGVGLGLGGVCMDDGTEPRSRGLLVMGSRGSPLSLSGGVRDPCII